MYGRAEIRNDAARRNFYRNIRSSSNHLLYCLNPTCFVNHWNRSSEWQTLFCDFLTSYLCGALLLSNFRSESCRSHCVQSHSSKASFIGGSMFRWWSGRSWVWVRMAFALFLFNIKNILADSKQTGVQAPSNGTSDKSIESGKLCVCSVSWPRIVLRIMVNIIVFFFQVIYKPAINYPLHRLAYRPNQWDLLN